MYNVLIADDEPLVQVGVKSMIDWKKYNINNIEIASNGKQALEIIEKHDIDIVITDVKMPIMDGLALVKTCLERYENPPEFIILTSYEEFEYAKEAIKYNVVDYLIKLELTEEVLGKAVDKALSNLNKKSIKSNQDSENNHVIDEFYEKFFIKLLYNLFDSGIQIKSALSELKLDLKEKYFITCFCGIFTDSKSLNNDEILNKYLCSLNMFKELCGKYLECFVIPLDFKRFSLVCCFKEYKEKDTEEFLSSSLDKISIMVSKYFNVEIKIGIGNEFDDLKKISLSFQQARQCFNLLDKYNKNIEFYNKLEKLKGIYGTFNMSAFKENLIKSFEEFDHNLFNKTMGDIIQILKNSPAEYLKALDCACNILYLSLSFLDDGESCIKKIFSKEVYGYRCIYEKNNTSQIIEWLSLFKNGILEYLKEQNKNGSNHIVKQVKKYINEHYSEKLTLNNVSLIYGITPSYLSGLFKKYSTTGFSEYITQVKVNRAKELLKENYKVYEVSYMIGFESAFYFSKVFKKVTGFSPKDYINRL